MNDAPRTWMDKASRVLVLQGGGALGAYQAGAFEALCASAYAPDWVAGISIGAINAALIAGNPPDRRHAALDAFWTRVSSQVSLPAVPWDTGDAFNAALNEWNAGVIVMAGVPGFFAPRVPPLPFQPRDDLTKLSIYDTEPLRVTLEEYVSFELINRRDVRLSVGAVDVESGQQVYFDNHTHTIDARHIMASAALPPGFPAIEIGKRYYWDGGLASNTPLDHVMRHKGDDDLLVLQLDLFSARGKLPTSLAEIAERGKDIRFASRTAMTAKKERKLYNANKNSGVHHAANAHRGAVTVLQLIYRSAVPEVASRDYNFSPLAIAAHRSAGQRDVARAMKNRDWLAPPPDGERMVEYVLTDDDARPVRRR